MTGPKPTLSTIERRVRLKLTHPRELTKIDSNLLQHMKELVSGAKRWPLLLFGPSGTGKTSAALALCDVAATAAYFDVEALCDRIMSGNDLVLFNWIGSKDLAILDELGTREQVGDLQYSAVKRFADARQYKPTIYISNLSPAQLAQMYDDRIYSRLTAGTVFKLDGNDRRRDQ